MPTAARPKAAKPKAAKPPAAGSKRSAATGRDPAGSASRGQFVYLSLRSLIHDGKLEPGRRVVEDEIAVRLGVSRTPVRDATQRLVAEGLLAVGPRRGLVVAELGRQQVIELYALREMLEGFAARLAAKHASEAEIAGLRHILGREAATADPVRLGAINRHFHQAIHGAARNRYLLESLNGLRDALALLRSTTFTTPDRPATALVEHTAIVDAIARDDPDAAEAASRAHIRVAGQLRLAMLFDEAGGPDATLDDGGD